MASKTAPLEPLLLSNLSILAKAYVENQGCKFASLSRYAHGDGQFFDKVVKGSGGCSLRKYDEVMAWFEANWPDGLAWPAGVWRPGSPLPRRR